MVSKKYLLSHTQVNVRLLLVNIFFVFSKLDDLQEGKAIFSVFEPPQFSISDDVDRFKIVIIFSFLELSIPHFLNRRYFPKKNLNKSTENCYSLI